MCVGGVRSSSEFDYDGGVNLAPGFKVTPAVELVSLLGRGGMGDVWLADHSGLGCRVVVKFLSSDMAENEDAVSRFKREASSAAAVKSPHVVQVFDHGITPDGIPFIVMEHLEGHDLSKHISRGPMAVADVSEIVVHVARGLGRAHQAGIVHRDIKPENIFLCDSGDGEIFVKLLDFGIAKAESKLSRATATGQIVGTPYYMSPEQIIGAKVDFKVDLWALAAVAFEALTGRVAFDGDNVGAITLAVHGEPPVPSHVRADLSPEIDAWFAKAFAKDAAHRHPNAKEMAQALQTAARVSSGTTSSFSFRAPLPSVDLAQSTGSNPAMPSGSLDAREGDSRSSKDAMASTHLASTIGLSNTEGTRSLSRSRALRVVFPLMAVAALVVMVGAWRANVRSSAVATSSTHASVSPVPSGATGALPSSPRVEPSAEALPALSAAVEAPVSAVPSATALLKGRAPAKPVPPIPQKPAPGKPKPGKYDDIQ